MVHIKWVEWLNYGCIPMLLVRRDLSPKQIIRENTCVALQQPQWLPSIEHMEDRNLFSLCVPGNSDLQGDIKDLLFGNMSSLLTVELMGSSLTGNIPEKFVKLKNLQNFIGCLMKGAGFSGHLPHDMGNITEMRVLCLEGNSFSGRIPRSISPLKRLTYLNLRNTCGMMQGNLDDLFATTSLEFLDVSGVHLSGKLPHVFPKNLKQIFLPGNDISGELPRGTKPALLNLANNQLTGDIPGH